MLRHRAIGIAVVLGAEILALTIAYQFVVTLDCQATDAYGLCRFLRGLVARVLVVSAALVVLIGARPDALRDFLAGARRPDGRGSWALLHLVGVLLLAVPVVAGHGRDISAAFGWAVPPLMLGGACALVGGLLWMAPLAAWRALLARHGATGLLVLALAALVPDLAAALAPLWDWQAVSVLTVSAVTAVLQALSQRVEVDIAQATVGIEGFVVQIAQQCSGVEGIALVIAFAALYALVFRAQIRVGRYVLVVLPLAILFSWALNVARIAGLILIGAYLSADVAVDSFHSYAGWLFFTLVALAMVWGVQRTAWLHKAGLAGMAPPMRDDPLAVLILPFAALLLAGLLTRAIFPHPDLGYPVKVILLAGVVVAFWRGYRALEWRADALPVLAGFSVGVLWLVLDRAAPDLALQAALAQMPQVDQQLWVAFRLIGTVLLVPLIEEMFFRGYLLRRLDRGGAVWRVGAILISSVLFGALHERWALAAAAGVVFALITLRRGRVTDAVQAHVAANLVVALGALYLGDWGRI